MARIGNRIAPGRYMLGCWRDQEARDAQLDLEQQVITTQRMTVIRCSYKAGGDFPAHAHPQEQITIVEEGALEFLIDGEPVLVRAGEMVVIAANVKHATRVPEGPTRALNLFVLPPFGAGFAIPAVSRPIANSESL